MRLSKLLVQYKDRGFYYFMHLFYYLYIPSILVLGIRSMDLAMFFPKRK